MKRTLLTTVVAALMCTTICAQTDSTASKPKVERKKVAVVLSGGGAKGMAHIGALKVIERAGIPIDYITGTSMGSIIGGLYAIGYNANSLDSMVRVQDWSYVITDKEDLTKQSLADRKKQNTYVLNRGITVGKLNYNDGGIIQGKNLAELFQQLCYGYTDSLDFSTDLPIPFACVATNVIDNSEYDFHSGRLPVAMRASMAIPAAFSPVRIGDMVLVDGGLRNNYPADIAREMGADIIIGVTVQGEPKIANDMGRTMSQLLTPGHRHAHPQGRGRDDEILERPDGTEKSHRHRRLLQNRNPAPQEPHGDDRQALCHEVCLREHDRTRHQIPETQVPHPRQSQRCEKPATTHDRPVVATEGRQHRCETTATTHHHHAYGLVLPDG